jgi:hypothetical protein
MLDVRRWTRYDWLWVAWLGSFLAIEVPALLDAKKGNTFSEAWWWFLGIGDTANKHARALRVVALSFTAWLVVHLWTRRV